MEKRKAMNEKEAAEKMVKEQDRLRLSCFSYLTHLRRMSEEELVTSGYRNKTTAEAMMIAFDSYNEKIGKLTREFLKNYPD